MKLWIGRICTLTVLLWNVQCALLFLLYPAEYSSGFELSGVSGQVFVQGLGFLFLMWNVPYIIAALNPIKWRTSLIEASIMQAIGFLGEQWLLYKLPDGHLLLQATLSRFIFFDGAGVVLLIVAIFVSYGKKIYQN